MTLRLVTAANKYQLMTRCITLDQAVLEKTKVDKVLQRLRKKGDEEGKKLAQKVLENAAAVSKQKSAESKTQHPQELEDKAIQNHEMSKPPIDSSRISENIAGTKKGKDADTISGQSTKQPTLNTSSPISNVTASSKSIALLGKRQQSSKVDPKSSTKSSLTAAPTPKVKSNHVSAKPSGFFSSLQSASKKPGTSNAALLAKAKQGKDG